jgi:RNA polymerase sigma-70 factor (sigma-E family)
MDGFKEFVETRYMDLLRIGFLLTGSAHDAEDLVQGSLVKLMRRWDRVDTPYAYMRRIMVNQHVTWWRRVVRRETVTDDLPELATGDAADGVVQRQELNAALRSLAPRTRAVVVLRYVADLPESEVAEILGCSLGTVKSQASRGLARLREVLETSERIGSYVDR